MVLTNSLIERGITHILSVVGFSPDSLRNLRDEPWSEYGKQFRHKVIDIDDVDDSNLLAELPAAVRFIHEGLEKAKGEQQQQQQEAEAEAEEVEEGGVRIHDGGGSSGGGGGGGGVFVHCAAGKSRSVSVVIAYLLWRYPRRFDTSLVGPAAYGVPRPPPGQAQTETQTQSSISSKSRRAAEAALALIRQTRPMAEPNDGFMQQLTLWWEMGCPSDVDAHPVYQRWAYRREVEEHVAVGQAPSRLRFEDEQQQSQRPMDGGVQGGTAAENQQQVVVRLRCKKCRRMLASTPFINTHVAAAATTSSTSSSSSSSGKSKAKFLGSAPPEGQLCPHYFIEPLSWMRSELERGELNGRFACPNTRCGAAVGRYDWKGIRCACGDWVTPGLSLQRARVDEEVRTNLASLRSNLGIRMPPGIAHSNKGSGNL
ncbi:Dual specificity phosphatase, catalytic domain protein [Moelleriella libera RCEF 2490]|uniref:protein-tyrosine-phosphatase n=1 Tax=Moelleriella libera RCEF 2490 TaxID=1081109 RepID=A0A168EWF9_9HYPO|nr:Dual specificity phosphatase, catalytic domain protein [Moelleriella libera RCEF 2490]